MSDFGRMYMYGYAPKRTGRVITCSTKKTNDPYILEIDDRAPDQDVHAALLFWTNFHVKTMEYTPIYGFSTINLDDMQKLKELAKAAGVEWTEEP